MRAVAAKFHVDVSTVSFWVRRAEGCRLDRADFSDHKSGRAWNRTPFDVKQRIAVLRSELRENVVGEYGARAIKAALHACGRQKCGSVTTWQASQNCKRVRINTSQRTARSFALRRRAPGEQPLLTTIRYHLGKPLPG